MDMDAVFRALADPSRRSLLDRLFALRAQKGGGGLTLGELCEGLDMSRQAVSKHLAQLEAATLVVVVPRGRERLHYLNPVPIQEIAERWIGKYEAARVEALVGLKKRVEAQMSDPWMLNNVAVVFIAATPERVWTALTDAEQSQHYFQGSRVEVGEVGEPYRVGRDDGWGVTGVVLIKEPPPHSPARLRVTWVVKGPPGVALPNCEIDYLVEAAGTPQGGAVTKLTVCEFVDGPVPPPFQKAGRTGWALITSNLKTYLETGASLPTVKLEPPALENEP